VYRIAAEARSSRQRYPRAFDFMCRICIQQCEQGCNYFVNTLLKKTSTTTISSQVVRPPTRQGAFLYDDFEYCCNRCFTRCALLSPGQSAAEQRDFARLDRRARRCRLWNIWLLLPLAIILLPFNFAPMRKSMISAPAFRAFRKVMPPMSRTEKEAIDAGTTWWEGDLFRGNPDWQNCITIRSRA
jgi:acyl-CoA dehydrogenase